MTLDNTLSRVQEKVILALTEIFTLTNAGYVQGCRFEFWGISPKCISVRT